MSQVDYCRTMIPVQTDECMAHSGPYATAPAATSPVSAARANSSRQ